MRPRTLPLPCRQHPRISRASSPRRLWCRAPRQWPHRQCSQSLWQRHPQVWSSGGLRLSLHRHSRPRRAPVWRPPPQPPRSRSLQALRAQSRWPNRLNLTLTLTSLRLRPASRRPHRHRNLLPHRHSRRVRAHQLQRRRHRRPIRHQRWRRTLPTGLGSPRPSLQRTSLVTSRWRVPRRGWSVRSGTTSSPVRRQFHPRPFSAMATLMTP
mmetsp:Transcript_5214/g.14416  ORF Transcript_5214/g.14416 Transcript_5214/m.14416 type:complete len:210 (+) Transcript_5214:562-1191(+)